MLLRREGNGNPLPGKYSVLGNPMDRGTWRIVVSAVARVGQNLETKAPPPCYQRGAVIWRVFFPGLQKGAGPDSMKISSE